MSKAIRRICLFGGPGLGKSTLATKIFFTLKEKNHNVELVSEFIKTWAHEGRKPQSYDQVYVFGKQLHSEDVVLRHVPIVITDSPILLSSAYSMFYGFGGSEHLTAIARQFELDFPSLNLFIERTVEYQQSGRYQNYDKAVEFDGFLQEYLENNLESKAHSVRLDKFEDIMSMIEVHMGN